MNKQRINPSHYYLYCYSKELFKFLELLLFRIEALSFFKVASRNIKNSPGVNMACLQMNVQTFHYSWRGMFLWCVRKREGVSFVQLLV